MSRLAVSTYDIDHSDFEDVPLVVYHGKKHSTYPGVFTCSTILVGIYMVCCLAIDIAGMTSSFQCHALALNQFTIWLCMASIIDCVVSSVTLLYILAIEYFADSSIKGFFYPSLFVAFFQPFVGIFVVATMASDVDQCSTMLPVSVMFIILKLVYLPMVVFKVYQRVRYGADNSDFILSCL